jgi:hypothetical protein
MDAIRGFFEFIDAPLKLNATRSVISGINGHNVWVFFEFFDPKRGFLEFLKTLNPVLTGTITG